MKKYDIPAFPFRQFDPDSGVIDWGHINDGMTLRDYFAGQALAGLMTQYLSDSSGSEEETIRNVVRISFISADAMLAEREKGE